MGKARVPHMASPDSLTVRICGRPPPPPVCYPPRMRITPAALLAFATLVSLPAQQPGASIDPPAEARQLLKLRGQGVQIYTCSAAPQTPQQASQQSLAQQNAPLGPQWTLKGPDAKLFDSTGNQVGTHSQGPTWKLNDGGVVLGAPLASKPSPNPASVPWLLLRAKPGSASGSLAAVAFIQRTETEGGIADKAACHTPSDLGKTVQVPYTATYTFYSAH